MSVSCPTIPLFNDTHILSPVNALKGKALNFIGRAVKVWDGSTEAYHYFTKSDIAHSLVKSEVHLSQKQIVRLNDRILEMANPYNDKSKTIEKVKQVLSDYSSRVPKKADSYDKALSILDQMKRENPVIPQLSFNGNLFEIQGQLQRGDIIVRKYHEDNPNPICFLQKFFRQKGYREAFKCSHVAIYLGEENDHAWVAEASMPHKNDPQVRRIRLDDERFALADKNTYLVFRNSDQAAVAKTVEFAKQMSVKMEPSAEKSTKEGMKERFREFKYNYLEAARSLWHSKNFGYFARQRLFKYYSDHHNQVPYQYILSKRNFFCSEFVMLSTQLGELENSQEFAKLIKANPPPKSNENKHKGFFKLVARIWYVVRRAIWCRYMAIKHYQKMKNVVDTKLDFLRSSPQDVVNYMMNEDNSHYKPMFAIQKSE